MLPLRYSRDKRMDIDSINGGTPATKGWLHPVCGVLHATDLYADNLYLTNGGSGIPGPPGPPGEQGPQGPPGTSASISVESVTTGAPGSAVIFQNVGAGPSAAFVVSIPRGDPGVGEQGPWRNCVVIIHREHINCVVINHRHHILNPTTLNLNPEHS